MTTPSVRNHGLSAGEWQIMELHDAGVAVSAIAEKLGLSETYVLHVTREYSFSNILYAGAQFNNMVRAGSRALERACARTGRKFT